MGSLYELANEFLAFKNQLEEMDLDPETMQDTLDSISLPMETKVENIVKYMRSLEAIAEAKKMEAKRLSESAASDLKKAEFFKNYMANNLKKAGINKLQAGIFSLGWRKGSEVVQVDESILEKETLPVPFLKYKEPELNKTELKKALKEGYTFKGISLVRNPDSLVVK